mgnify:FL=1
MIIGLHEKQEMSWGGAVFAVLIPVIIVVVIAVVIVILLFGSIKGLFTL